MNDALTQDAKKRVTRGGNHRSTDGFRFGGGRRQNSDSDTDADLLAEHTTDAAEDVDVREQNKAAEGGMAPTAAPPMGLLEASVTPHDDAFNHQQELPATFVFPLLGPRGIYYCTTATFQRDQTCLFFVEVPFSLFEEVVRFAVGFVPATVPLSGAGDVLAAEGAIRLERTFRQGAPSKSSEHCVYMLHGGRGERTQSRSFTDSGNTAVRRVALLLEVPSRGTEIFVRAFGSHRAAEDSDQGPKPLISCRSEAEDMLGAMGFEALCNLSFTDVTATSADAPVAFFPCMSWHCVGSAWEPKSAEDWSSIAIAEASAFIF